MTRPPIDEEARQLEQCLRSALSKAVDFRQAAEDPSPARQGPGSLIKEYEALRKALAVAIRASGPFIV